jgi:hypothetical protein
MRNRAGTERLAKIPLFQGLSARQLSAVDALVTTIDVPRGRELIRQREPGHELVVHALLWAATDERVAELDGSN